MTDVEQRYEVHDQELLAIVEGFKKWRYYLARGNSLVEVLSDYSNLKYFISTKSLSAHQARWVEELSKYNFEILYRPGARNPADGFSRRPDYESLAEVSVSLMLLTL